MANLPANCDITGTELKLRGFNAYAVQPDARGVPSYNRRDFYKICLNDGRNRIHYADKGIETTGPILFFGNPHVPYSWETIEPPVNGYACLFTEDFLKAAERAETWQQSPLFKIGGTPIVTLSTEQAAFVASLFQKMIGEQETDYVFKDELIRTYISLIIHEAMKMQPAETYFKHNNASQRIASMFLELLERQFPIESPERPLQLKTAQDFASGLSVHVNHLNRAVKEVTGKPTTAHISERIAGEARALLQHTDWSVAQVGYALGFEYPTYFNNYFKRTTGTTPKALRAV